MQIILYKIYLLQVYCMQMVVLMACLMVLVICNSLPTQGARVPVGDEAIIYQGADQLNVDDLYGHHRVKIVRRSPEPLGYISWMSCTQN